MCVCKTNKEINKYELAKAIKNKDKYYYKRVGKCNPKKCNAYCCKFIVFEANNSYMVNHGQEVFINGQKRLEVMSVCKFLNQNKCTIFNKKEFPLACSCFPMWEDGHYQIVKEICGFKFIKTKIKGGLK